MNLDEHIVINESLVSFILHEKYHNRNLQKNYFINILFHLYYLILFHI